MSHEWLLETLGSMLDSPITFVAIGLAFSLGLWRGWWWSPAVVALIAGCASALVFYKHWVRLGIDVSWQAGQAVLLFMIYTYPAFAVARLLVRIKDDVEGDKET
ncbi:MAG: hypothetical protein AB7S92_03345 [Parvibaculaceae bacterium]